MKLHSPVASLASRVVLTSRSLAQGRGHPRRPGLGRTLFLFPFLSLTPLPAEAKVLLSETFSYPDGVLVLAPAAPWKTLSGAEAQVQVAEGALTLTQDGTEVVGVLLAGQPFTSGRLYAGFTVEFQSLPSEKGASFGSFTDASGQRELDRVFATTSGAAPGSLRIGTSTVDDVVVANTFIEAKSPPPVVIEKPVIEFHQWVNTGFTSRARNQRGVSYRFQRKASLFETEWTTVQGRAGTGEVLEFADGEPPAQSAIYILRAE